MTTQPNALDLAFALAVLIDGWTPNENTLRMKAENDSAALNWAALEHPRHPGACLTINTSQHTGRISIRASYPQDWTPYFEGRGRVYAEEITVSAEKTQEQIAADIKRRILDGHYLHAVRECMERKAAHEAGQRAGAELARELARIVGTQTLADRHRHNPRADHYVTDENDRRFEVIATVTYRRQLEGRVAFNAERVALTFDNLTPQHARELLLAWQQWREHEEQEARDDTSA
jgi:hypothetical protein